ncbi:MAG TPA: SPOR domain-containing protein [Blastocatellia bacterium]|nr:SPOR domain-containing protein [Blastocatellia bacterium]
MKVTCPKCQFENQADSSRVVCARCATIIEVRMDQGFDSNGKRQTARLPFTSGGLSGGPSLGSQRFNQSDVYATRIGDDFDDVLDVPIQPQSGYQTVDETAPPPIFEDVFASGQNQDPPSPYQDPPSPYDYSAYDKPSAPLSAPLDAYGTPGLGQRAPQDYIESAEQEYVGWPVLPEGQEEEEEEAKSGRGGLFLRLGLIVGLLGVLSFWGYYFLGDLIRDRIKNRNSAATPEVAQVPQNTDQATETPATPPAQEPPPANDQNSNDQNSSETPSQSGRGKDPGAVEPSLKPGDTGKSKGIAEAPPAEPPLRAAQSKGGGLTIQVGSFKDQGEAEAKASSLNAVTGGDFHVVQAQIPGRGVWYRVQQVNGFPTREAAAKYGNGLRTKNLVSDYIITAR